MTEFESQKVRGLLAYLALARDRTFTRDHLAAVLWPEGDDDSARRNFRQAIYNLRQVVDPDPGEEPLLEVSRQTVTLRSGSRLWLDVDAFEDHLARARVSNDLRVERSLAAAARLYQGNLLAGFHLGDSAPFEEWLLGEQERLREAAIGALVQLMDHHMDAGTYTLGVEYGRKLLEIDPLSETGHRKLMRLHAFSGRRSRAITAYRNLERLLADELGVEPLEETRAVYQAIVAEEIPGAAVRELAEPVGPLVPLVGREEALDRLREHWQAVRRGSGRLTLVTGEPGIGKTRLVKTFLHQATLESPALVLQGRGHERVPPIAYASLCQALDDAVVHEVEVAERLIERLSPEELQTLALLAPSLEELRAGPPAKRRSSLTPDMVADAVAAALAALAAGPVDGEHQPVILFLDDLRATGASTLELLAALRERIRYETVWILGAWSAQSSEEALAAEGAENGMDRALASHGLGDGEAVALGRLNQQAVLDLAGALVPERGEELATLLAACAGWPLAITETINWLWDEGCLVEHHGGTWSVDTLPEPGTVPANLEEIVHARLAELPTSTRRLFTLAAVAGPEVDAELLEAAEREHGVVVDTGIRVLLERWMGRLRLGYWADSRHERDVTLWTSGSRRRTFDFAHPMLREVVYSRLDPDRRALLHRRVAEAFEDRLATGARRRSETLGYHYVLGRAWSRALPHLEAAAGAALALGASATAAWYRDRAGEALDALAAERPGDGGAWKEVRKRWQELDGLIGRRSA